MACDAILLADATRFSGMVAQGFFRWRHDMTSQALLVIAGWIIDERLVRIVAGDASEARIAVTPATAVFKTIGLEAHIGDAGDTHFINVIQRSVASAAEIDKSDGIQPSRIEDFEAALLVHLVVHQFHMFGARAMTRLAGHSRH